MASVQLQVCRVKFESIFFSNSVFCLQFYRNHWFDYYILIFYLLVMAGAVVSSPMSSSSVESGATKSQQEKTKTLIIHADDFTRLLCTDDARYFFCTKFFFGSQSLKIFIHSYFFFL